jgi:hypothetical protein
MYHHSLAQWWAQRAKNKDTYQLGEPIPNPLSPCWINLFIFIFIYIEIGDYLFIYLF